MSIEGLNWALNRDEVKETPRKFILLILGNYADENGFCYPSYENMHIKTGISTRSIMRHVDWLIKNKYIERHHRRKSSRQLPNLYKIIHPDFQHDMMSRSLKVQRDINASQRDRESSNGHDTMTPNTKEEIQKKDTKERKSKLKLESLEIFSYWKKITQSSNSKMTFTDERKRKVKQRLKKYSIEDIKKAIRGCNSQPHNNGQTNGTVYKDLELICRNDTKLEYFINLNQPLNSKPNKKNLPCALCKAAVAEYIREKGKKYTKCRRHPDLKVEEYV